MAYTPNDAVGADWTLSAGGSVLLGLRDIDVSDSDAEIDISDRDGRNKKFATGMTDFTISGKALVGSAGAATLDDAKANHTVLVFLLSPKTGGTGSAKSYSFSGVVTEFSVPLPLEGAAEASFKLRPQGDVTRAAVS
mgnify:CR=1 FL=1